METDRLHDPTDYVDTDPPEAFIIDDLPEKIRSEASLSTRPGRFSRLIAISYRVEDLIARLHDAERGALPDKANARRTDPATSKAAAATIDDLSDRHWAVWACLSERPSTDSELLARYHQRETLHAWPKQTPQSIRSRRAELVQAGHVEHSGLYGLSDTGRSAIIWRTVG